MVESQNRIQQLERQLEEETRLNALLSAQLTPRNRPAPPPTLSPRSVTSSPRLPAAHRRRGRSPVVPPLPSSGFKHTAQRATSPPRRRMPEKPRRPMPQTFPMASSSSSPSASSSSSSHQPVRWPTVGGVVWVVGWGWWWAMSLQPVGVALPSLTPVLSDCPVGLARTALPTRVSPGCHSQVCAQQPRPSPEPHQQQHAPRLPLLHIRHAPVHTTIMQRQRLAAPQHRRWLWRSKLRPSMHGRSA